MAQAPPPLSRFQQDIENKATAAWQQQLKLTAQLAACQGQLGEMFAACTWLDAKTVEQRAIKREDQDTAAIGPRRGGVHV